MRTGVSSAADQIPAIIFPTIPALMDSLCSWLAREKKDEAVIKEEKETMYQ
jgi:hypothetical protein